MAHDGVVVASEMLKANENAKDAVETAVRAVEDYPFYKSVGFGGLPNEDGIVELDAAFMDGDTFAIGAIAGVRNIANPVSVARKLSNDHFNSFRVGEGANKYAMVEGFENKNMLTERSKKMWEKRVAEMREKNLSAYDGHDTVGMVTLDQNGSMASATSTSGLFMKKEGRIGDSALSGSGFYVDSEVGGASATGLGEDLMKGILSYEIVRLMKDGMHPQQAADKATFEFEAQMLKRYGKCGAFSLVALNKEGEWGVATNVEFTFSVATHKQEPSIFLANPNGDMTTKIEPITQEWLDAYEKRIKAPIE
jgi:isoaspartyl peptidase/L-asparaginase-like protein (Ntn-hydrolase superfamily)